MMNIKFSNTFNYKLIYIFRINDEAHKGVLKIGDATIHTTLSADQLTPNCRDLNQAAKERINAYTSTANIPYDLLYTELAVSTIDGKTEGFRDYDVHRVLKASGIKPHYFNAKQQNEWYKTDLESAKRAIVAVKEGRKSLNNSEISKDKNPIIFRPEQVTAIERTVAQFKKGNVMLWNAKMRFGKTLSSLEVAKRMGFKRTIIFTHRPVVSSGWFDDFRLIFNDDYLFGSKQNGVSLSDLNKSGKNYVYFASIQDLRGSNIVGGKYDKNIDLFDNRWEFVIIDEAHEGTKTQYGDNIKLLLTDKTTKVLELSGTPYNLISDYKESEIYTWDYVMEQSAKADWIINNFGDTNPYEGLPRLNIFTYSLNKIFDKYVDFEDKAFNFREFFRVWSGNIKIDKRHMPEDAKVDDFVHKEDIISFLNLITKDNVGSNYPFSNDEYRNYFRHSLWMVPGVKEAKALSALLKSHHIFGNGAFNIANVAGDGDEEENTKEALKKVEDAIGTNPDDSYSITISCGRLTTGVSVKPWTAVLMLSGSYSTKAATYMQTIFRVQTPATINGRVKEECYVFDFAPDRTLKIIAEATKISAKAGKTSDDDRDIIGEFLNFCPVISIDGTAMTTYDVDGMLQQLKRVYTDKVVSSGFDDIHIYNDKLLKLDNLELLEFNELKKIIGASKQTKKQNDVDINNQGLTNEEYERAKQAEKKPKKDLTDEEKELLEKRKKKQEQKQSAISILRGIAIRIPLLIYGANKSLDEDITVDNFTDSIDPQSWEEFMPKGVTKQKFNYFAKYFDPDIFVAAGRKIRNQARNADELSPTERVKRIAEIFATFKNPDKETVLTPWRVVNMHLGDCLGGYDFYDVNHKEPIEEPRFVNHGTVTAETLANEEACILEINSKTGLYPLYVAYSIYRQRCSKYDESQLDFDTEWTLWLKTIEENLYVICKTPMAKQITKRTLVGYRDAKVNARYFEDLINQIKNKTDNFITKVKDGQGYWKTNRERNMKFNAIVGNPPYQLTKEGTSDSPAYHLFMDVAFSISSKVTLITPARFLFNAGKTPKAWNEKVLNDEHLKVIWYKPTEEVFENVDIKGGIAVTYRDSELNFGKIGTYTKSEELNSILKKVSESDGFNSLMNYIYSPESYKLSNTLHSEHPDIEGLLSNGHKYDVTTNIFEKLSRILYAEKPNDNSQYIQLYGKDTERRYLWIKRDYIKPHPNLDCYKVILPKSNGSGVLGEEFSSPIVGMPNIGHTQTFISIGAFNTLFEADATLKYIKSKFVRTMIGILKVTQDNKQAVWKYVPMQNFTQTSDIDWNKPIKEIDSQLYKKYNLTPDEITFIESTIKPME
ncbi:MAG: Eco57I restriction-modification methylase domain-containing protein [Rikenellaceae bacterium]